MHTSEGFTCPIPGRWKPSSFPSAWNTGSLSRRSWEAQRWFMTGLRRDRPVANSDHKFGRRLSGKAGASLWNKPCRRRLWLQASSWYRTPYCLPIDRPKSRSGYRSSFSLDVTADNHILFTSEKKMASPKGRPDAQVLDFVGAGGQNRADTEPSPTGF